MGALRVTLGGIWLKIQCLGRVGLKCSIWRPLFTAGVLAPHWMSLLPSLLIAFATGLLAVTFWRYCQLRRQAIRIQEAALAITRGDTSARVDASQGLLPDVGAAFNEMATQVEHELRTLKTTQAELERLVATDRLTGVGNRRAFEQLTELEVAKSNRYGVPATLILFDVDNFKKINDNYGHAVGDSVLVRIVRRVTSRLRDTDSIARWGGEEFAVVTPCTPISGTYVVAEAIRRAVEEDPFLPVGQVTISLGIAQLLPHETADLWVARADRFLYEAKRQGRNRTCLSETEDERSRPFLLLWGEQFFTHVDCVDKEHAEIFRLANDLILLHPGSPLTEQLKHFDRLCEHLVIHFQSEEQVLRDMGCAEVELHAAAHLGLLAQAKDLRRRLVEGQVAPFDLGDFVVRHVAIGHLVAQDLPLFASLRPSASQPITPSERPSLRIRLQRAIGR